MSGRPNADKTLLQVPVSQEHVRGTGSSARDFSARDSPALAMPLKQWDTGLQLATFGHTFGHAFTGLDSARRHEANPTGL